jgi:Domain of unknown function (DUF4251)
MKTINKSFGKIYLLSFLAIVYTTFTYAQTKESKIKNMIEERRFIFHAQTALPLTGSSRQLTSEYDLRVTRNYVTSYLPFFGRAYSLPYNPTEGGFNFTSTKFDYSVSARKKDGWEINIKPKDVPDFREFSLSISENGYGTLRTMSNNRQPISFTGYISSLK